MVKIVFALVVKLKDNKHENGEDEGEYDQQPSRDDVRPLWKTDCQIVWREVSVIRRNQ